MVPGGRSRRLVIQPSRVFVFLLCIFVLGVLAATTAMGLVVRDVRSTNDALAAEMATLRSEVDRLTAEASAPEEPTDAPANTTVHEPASASLDIRTSSLRSPEPTVRIAVSSDSGSMVLRGEGLHFIHKGGRTTPLPGKVELRVAQGAVVAKGIGKLQKGVAIETRLGPIRVGKERYPGRMEIFRDGDRLLLVNEVKMEHYVASVVSAELPSGWGLQAKKAQAVAARTYAFMRRADSKKDYDLDGTVADQVYRGNNIDSSSRAAVTATRGQVLSKGGRLVSAFYSSTCGGETEDPGSVWPGRPSHGLQSVECGHCTNSHSMKWKATVSEEELLKAAAASGHRAKTIDKLLVAEKHPSGRNANLELKTNRGAVLWGANEFRQLLGWDKVRSTLFRLKRLKDGYEVQGRGFGHGVGLCQWGAQGMDRKGIDYKEILERYYPDANLEALY